MPALNRARGVIETYDGAPATTEALKIGAAAYRKLGMTDMAKIADQIRADNAPADQPGEKTREPKDSWWRFWN